MFIASPKSAHGNGRSHKKSIPGGALKYCISDFTARKKLSPSKLSDVKRVFNEDRRNTALDASQHEQTRKPVW
jgi:hypothetical protein